MTDYFKYLLSPAILSLHAWGMWMGGNYTWIGLAVLVGVLCFDAFLPRDYSMRDQRYVRIYDVICAMTVLASFGNIFSTRGWWVPGISRPPPRRLAPLSAWCSSAS